MGLKSVLVPFALSSASEVEASFGAGPSPSFF